MQYPCITDPLPGLSMQSTLSGPAVGNLLAAGLTCAPQLGGAACEGSSKSHVDSGIGAGCRPTIEYHVTVLHNCRSPAGRSTSPRFWVSFSWLCFFAEWDPVQHQQSPHPHTNTHYFPNYSIPISPQTPWGFPSH